MTHFEELRRVVLGDARLLSALAGTKNLEELFALTLEAARETGIPLERGELEAVVQQNRREGLLRGLPW